VDYLSTYSAGFLMSNIWMGDVGIMLVEEIPRLGQLNDTRDAQCRKPFDQLDIP
jgi:hypothetical protein